MEYRIIIQEGNNSGSSTGQSGGTSGTAPPQTPLPSGSGSPAAGSPSSPGSTAPGLVEFGGNLGRMMREAQEAEDKRRKDTKTVAEAMDPTAKVAQQLAEEQLERARSIAALKERNRLDTPAMEAARLYEEDTLLRRRMLEVMKERHKIEGAAAEEARMQLEGQKEAKDWQRKVNEERRKQDPGSAAANDVGDLGGLVSQISGSKGLGGYLGRMMQMAPKAYDEFGKLFGGEADPTKQAAGASRGAAVVPAGAKAAAEAKASGQPDYAGQLGKMAQGGQQLQQAGKGVGQISNLMGGSEAVLGGVEGAAALAGGAEAGGAAAGMLGGAGAGLLGGAAAAAGPVGIAVAAAVGAAELAKEGSRQATEQWRHFGEQVKSVVSDNYLGAFTEAAHDAAGSLTGVLGKGGLLWGLAADVGAEYVKQFGERLKIIAGVQEEFLKLGQKIGPFSAAITSAQASAQVRDIFGDMREADVLGGGIARLTEAQSKTTDALRELLSPVKKIALEGVTIPQELLAELFGREQQQLRGRVEEINRRLGAMFEAWRQSIGLPGEKDDPTLQQLVRAFGEGNIGNEFRLVNGEAQGGAPFDPANFRGGF